MEANNYKRSIPDTGSCLGGNIDRNLWENAGGILGKYNYICPKFVSYFKNTCASIPIKWIICYKQFEHVNIHTNMLAESFHNKLKTFYLQRMSNKQIDDLINVLLEIEADYYWSHKKISVCLNVPKKDIDRDIRIWERNKYSDIHMTALPNSKWSVQSQSKNMSYMIKQITENCNWQLGKQQISCEYTCQYVGWIIPQ